LEEGLGRKEKNGKEGRESVLIRQDSNRDVNGERLLEGFIHGMRPRRPGSVQKRRRDRFTLNKESVLRKKGHKTLESQGNCLLFEHFRYESTFSTRQTFGENV